MSEKIQAPESAGNGAGRAERRILAKGLVLILSLAACVAVARMAGLDHLFSSDWVDTQIRGRGLTGVAVYLAATALITAAGVPRQVPAFLGGYAFGAALGALWGTLGATLGCAVCFLYARYLGRDYVSCRFGRRIRGVDRFLGRRPFGMAVVIRFMPLGSNLLTNLLAGVSSVRALPFFSGSAVGYLPQSLVFALLGSGVHVDPFWRTTLSIALFVASTLWGFRLYRLHRRELEAGEA